MGDDEGGRRGEEGVKGVESWRKEEMADEEGRMGQTSVNNKRVNMTSNIIRARKVTHDLQGQQRHLQQPILIR